MEQERERLEPDTNSLSVAVNTTAGVGTETLVAIKICVSEAVTVCAELATTVAVAVMGPPSEEVTGENEREDV